MILSSNGISFHYYHTTSQLDVQESVTGDGSEKIVIVLQFPPTTKIYKYTSSPRADNNSTECAVNIPKQLVSRKTETAKKKLKI